MTAQDFMPESEFKRISALVLSHEQFEYEKTVEKFEFRIHSGSAGWHSKTVKEGDYILGAGFSKYFGDYSGCSFPMELREYQPIISSYSSFLDFFNGHMKHIAGDRLKVSEKVSYGTVEAQINDNGQIALF